ncbi:MAG: carboxypeptidase regulatory-like domain-containing protein [Patescibacteria group bacterium]
MRLHIKLSSTRKAVTLIEVVIDMAILSLISTVVIMAMASSIKTVNQSSRVAAAGQLVNEKLEHIRNLSYDSLATQNGPIVPQGNILDQESVTRDKFQFVVHTDIRYVDDAYDSLVGSGDLNPADYKRVTITVLDTDSSVLATLSTDIASRAAETASNTGVLKLKVLDANGSPVPDATIVLTNASVNPPVNVTTTTDAAGGVFIPNLTPAGNYHIVASKVNYSSDSTTPISVANPSPTNPDATILLQQPTEVTLSIDLTSSLTINITGVVVFGGDAALVGQKLIGQNPDVVKNQVLFVINPIVQISNLEFDSYNITPPIGFFIKTCSPTLPIIVSPNSAITVNCDFTIDPTDVRISNINPNQFTAAAGVSIEISGANLTLPEFSLQRGSDAEIPFNTGLTVGQNNTLVSGTVDFSALTLGSYDLIYRDAQGHTARQTEAIVIE